MAWGLIEFPSELHQRYIFFLRCHLIAFSTYVYKSQNSCNNMTKCENTLQNILLYTDFALRAKMKFRIRKKQELANQLVTI